MEKSPAIRIENAGRVYAVLLAAGRSRRFGSAKQLAKFRGESLVRRSARIAREVCGDRTALVAGFRADEVIEAAGGYCAITLVNEDFDSGMGGSIALATRALAERADALLILLADQPLVSTHHLGKLLATWSGASNELVASGYSGVAGPPVLLPSDCFAELQNLAGDRGASRFFSDPRYELTIVHSDAAGVDIDLPEHLEMLR
ncbi:MAG TPA: nucleotidyltransferase family protein [Woeseiaceae bacterium]|nr:nucleotidyltransferase family protein [Woeseiaceae bacterium]